MRQKRHEATRQRRISWQFSTLVLYAFMFYVCVYVCVFNSTRVRTCCLVFSILFIEYTG